MPSFLHVGCGPKHQADAAPGLRGADWREVRYDIDAAAEPDVVGSMLDMSALAPASFDAVFSSHSIEHLYAHEVPQAFAEFLRVLAPQGFLVLTCPDLQSICELVAEGRLLDTAIESPAGPVAAIDMLFGYRPALAAGNAFMAHKCGLTLPVLLGTLKAAGFGNVAGRRRGAPYFDLWVVASKDARDDDAMRRLAIAQIGG